MTAPSTQTVKGDLLRIDGDFYVVKDTAGKEIRLHVDKTSQLDGAFKTGDKIEAQATEKGHAASIDQASRRCRVGICTEKVGQQNSDRGGVFYAEYE